MRRHAHCWPRSARAPHSSRPWPWSAPCSRLWRCRPPPRTNSCAIGRSRFRLVLEGSLFEQRRHLARRLEVVFDPRPVLGRDFELHERRHRIDPLIEIGKFGWHFRPLRRLTQVNQWYYPIGAENNRSKCIAPKTRAPPRLGGRLGGATGSTIVRGQQNNAEKSGRFHQWATNFETTTSLLSVNHLNGFRQPECADFAALNQT